VTSVPGSSILAVNAGSSSLKFSVHTLDGGVVQPAVAAGALEGLEPGGHAQMSWTASGTTQHRAVTAPGGSAFAQALNELSALLPTIPGLPRPVAVAHRVVHGGRTFVASVRVTDDVLTQLERLCSLAPLHQPHNLDGIREFARVFPDLPQVACFDTAFHATMPDLNRAFALPASLTDRDVRRYGFHGLSYQYIIGALLRCSQRALGRVVMAHLGNGASLCATRDGRSFDTTMGFSALDGLMMGTRTGALDPGVLLYLIEQGWDHDRLQDLLYRQSGLLGVSGVSADMRRLRADDGVLARRAIALFTHCVVRETGALCAVLGGLDVLAFSAGIGEHDAELRAQVCQGLGWLGVELDVEANRRAVAGAIAPVHSAASRIEVWVVPTDEGIVAAREAVAVLGLVG
jgi:acetate kinase